MSQPYVAPVYQAPAFNCPFCNAYANQNWQLPMVRNFSGYSGFGGFHSALCAHCQKYSMWKDEKLLYPDTTIAPLPNPDLPENVTGDYQEAASIVARSPRGSAALLRLCIQKLCKHLGESGHNINDDIAALVKKGLSPMIQKSLDIVRVIGNESVHPGTIDIRDDQQTAIQLCQLVNLITEVMITQPKLVNALYASLPEDKKSHIEKRDKKS